MSKKLRKIKPRARGETKTDYNPAKNLCEGARTNTDSIPTIEQMRITQSKGLRDLASVPGLLLAQKRRRCLSDNEVCFYIIFMQYANHKGVLSGTYDDVQEMTGCARRTVAKVLVSMERKGLIVRRYVKEKGRTLLRLNPCSLWKPL